jgi:hypothetical protein
MRSIAVAVSRATANSNIIASDFFHIFMTEFVFGRAERPRSEGGGALPASARVPARFRLTPIARRKEKRRVALAQSPSNRAVER